MEDFLETFHIDWGLMLAQLVNFGLVFLALYFIAAKPLRKLMDERTREIEGGLKDAKSNSELLEKTKREYDIVLSKARTEANDIFERGKKEAEEKKSAMLEDAKVQVADMIAAGKKSLEMEKSKMVEDAKRDIISLVISSTEKVAGKVDAAHTDNIKKELGML